MSSPIFYANEVEQSFISDSNVFLKLSAPNGQESIDGKELKTEVLTLVIPLVRFQRFTENINECNLSFNASELQPQSEEKFTIPTVSVILGVPLTIPD